MMSKVQDIYYDMTPREVAKLFGKSLQTVTVGVSRMAKDHPEWKIKDGRSVTITAAGVEWLAETYFRLDKYEMQLIDEQQARMQREIDYLNQQLAEKQKELDRYDENLKLAIKEKNDADDKYRLENDKKMVQIQQLELKTRQYESDIKVKEDKIKEVEDTLHLKEKELDTKNEELSKFKKKKLLGFEFYVKEK